MKETFKQCTFKKGTEETVAFIPSWAAKVGNRVELLSLDGEFWTVISVGDLELEKAEVQKQQRVYKEFQGSTKGGTID